MQGWGWGLKAAAAAGEQRGRMFSKLEDFRGFGFYGFTAKNGDSVVGGGGGDDDDDNGSGGGGGGGGGDDDDGDDGGGGGDDDDDGDYGGDDDDGDGDDKILLVRQRVSRRLPCMREGSRACISFCMISGAGRCHGEKFVVMVAK